MYNEEPYNFHIQQILLDFKFSPRYECCILSLGSFPGLWILCADVSENCSSFLGRVDKTRPMKMEYTECFEKSAHKIQTQGNHPKERQQQILLEPSNQGARKERQRPRRDDIKKCTIIFYPKTGWEEITWGPESSRSVQGPSVGCFERGNEL